MTPNPLTSRRHNKRWNYTARAIAISLLLLILDGLSGTKRVARVKTLNAESASLNIYLNLKQSYMYIPQSDYEGQNEAQCQDIRRITFLSYNVDMQTHISDGY